MPPRRFKKKSVKRIVEKRVAKAIEEYEKTRADSNNTGGSGSANTRGTVAPDVQGCSYKTFMNGKPHSFSGTEGVVGLKRWFEKMEQVFEICKCAEDDKVKSPGATLNAMMTTEYCPTMKSKGWSRAFDFGKLWKEMTYRGIQQYRFMNWGIKGIVTSSKHGGLCMMQIQHGSRNLIETRGSGYGIKDSAPAKGRGYTGNLPWCNRCKAHHQPGPCPPRCGNYTSMVHQNGSVELGFL
ncbi:hypothetical protein Tco_1410397 [Tanacetum coccineum]